MAAKVTVQPDEVSLRRFMEATAELGRLSGRDFRDVIRHELEAMLNAAIRGTKKATVAGVTRNVMEQRATTQRIAYRGIESRTGRTYSPKAQAKAEARAARARGGGNYATTFMLPASGYNHRHPEWLWRRLMAGRAGKLKWKLGARGITARMFVHIAEGLALTVKAPAFVRKAKHAQKGDLREMVQTSESGKDKRYSIGFVNNLTKANIGAGAARAFSSAMRARANFLSKSMKLAADGKIKGVLQRYPGLATLT
jgi:hypothetical protein